MLFFWDYCIALYPNILSVSQRFIIFLSVNQRFIIFLSVSQHFIIFLSVNQHFQSIFLSASKLLFFILDASQRLFFILPSMKQCPIFVSKQFHVSLLFFWGLFWICFKCYFWLCTILLGIDRLLTWWWWRGHIKGFIRPHSYCVRLELGFSSHRGLRRVAALAF